MQHNKFSETLKIARIRAGMTQTVLCKKVSPSDIGSLLSQATLSAWESGRQLPSPEMFGLFIGPIEKELGIIPGTLLSTLTAESDIDYSPRQDLFPNLLEKILKTDLVHLQAGAKIALREKYGIRQTIELIESLEMLARNGFVVSAINH